MVFLEIYGILFIAMCMFQILNNTDFKVKTRIGSTFLCLPVMVLCVYLLVGRFYGL